MIKQKFLSAMILLTISTSILAQDVLTLDTCMSLAAKNYPLIKQASLYDQQHALQQENISKQFLPQLSLDAQATYQSEVTYVPVETPGLDIPRPNKDQYKATVNLNQMIYDGGVTKGMNTLQEAQYQVQQQQVMTSLYKLKESVNLYYFSVLSIMANQETLKNLVSNLESKRKELLSAVKNGAVLSVNIDLIDIELLNIQQRDLELNAQKNAKIAGLEQLIGIPIGSNTIFELPGDHVLTFDKSIGSRPELTLMAYQKQQLEASSALLVNKKAPRLFAFAQGGIGNPGLNFLDNTFQPFYMAGIKLNWTITDWSKTKNERMISDLNQLIVDNQMEIFEFNESLKLIDLLEQIKKQQKSLVNQQQIITLQKKVVKNYESQYQNGALKYSDYLDELTALNQAEIKLQSDEIELHRLLNLYEIIKGN